MSRLTRSVFFCHIRIILGFGLIVLAASLASAQTSADRIKTIQTNLNNAKAAFDQLPDQMKQISRSWGRMAHLAGAVNRMASGLAKGPKSGWQPSPGWDEGGSDENGLIQVNNPARDLRFSPFMGFTQNNAATARCGDNVVVAFNDSGSTLETLLTGQGGVSDTGTVGNGTGGISLVGYATSHNGGESFKDRGALNPGPDVDLTLAGKPSVACTSPNNFLLVQIAGVPNLLEGHSAPLSGITLSRSTDGGATWGDPVIVAVPDPNIGDEIFEDPWIAVDPSNPKRVYISYTHFGFNFITEELTSSVELISSIDGGQTFNPTPIVMEAQHITAFTGLFDVGTRMAISSKGTVFVAWENENIFEAFFEQTISVGSFTPGGGVTPAVVVDAVTQGGSNVFEFFTPFGESIVDGEVFFGTVPLQGGFENFRGFDLAVDHSGGPTDGFVYLFWDDGRNGFQAAPELEDDFGAYSFTDILLAVSKDGGQTFAPTRQVNSDLQPLTSRGHDHFRPVAAVDKNGKVAACWYDRRNDPQNYQFERFCAESTDAGSTWGEFRVPGSLSTPVITQDLLLRPVDMGTNDNLTTDFSGHAPGFIGGIQWMSSGMNPDVKEVRFR
jgi:hypothetical protein